MWAWGCATAPLTFDSRKCCLPRGLVCSAGERVLCIDVGTSGTKAALVLLRDGHIGHVGRGKHSIYDEEGSGRVEQRVSDWEKSVRDAVRGLREENGKNVVAVGVTGQMQDLLWEGGERIILYGDSRGGVIEGLAEEWGGPTGLLGKMLWVLKKDDEGWEGKINGEPPRWLLGAADWLVWRLCNARVCDPTTASTTGLATHSGRAWKAEEMVGMGLPRQWVDSLPRLIERPKIAGAVSKDAAGFLGLPWSEGLPVVHAGGDAATTTFGSVGELGHGRHHLYVGSSGWIGGTFRENPIKDELSSSVGELVSKEEEDASRNVVFSLAHPVPGYYIGLASMVSAGGCVEWVIRDLYQSRYTFADCMRMAEDISVGSQGLLFLPHISGERCPFVDEKVRGALIGLSNTSGPSTVFRSVMEGLAFNYKACMTKLVDNGLFPDKKTNKELVVVGGGTKNRALMQILADVLNVQLSIESSADTAGLRGVALVAGLALSEGKFCCENRDVMAASQADVKIIIPRGNNVARYENLYETWLQLYPVLKNVFTSLSSFQRAGFI